MRSLLLQVRKLKKEFKGLTELGEDTMVIFAVDPEHEWDADNEEYIGAVSTIIEPYVIPEHLERYFYRARNLQELKKLAEQFCFEICVFPSECTIEECWADWNEDMQNN